MNRAFFFTKKYDFLKMNSYLNSALPLVLGNCMNSFQNLFIIFLASYISFSATAALGYVNRVYFIYGVFIICINNAGSIRLNRFSAGVDDIGFNATLKTMKVCSYFLTGLCFLVFFVGSRKIAHLANPERDVESLVTYIRWMAVAFISVTLASPYYMALVARKKSIHVLKAILLSVSSCLLFLFITVVWLDKGLPYLGVGSALSQICYACVVFYVYKKVDSDRAAAQGPSGNVSGIKFKNSFLKDSLNILFTMLIAMLVDFLIIHMAIEDVQFVVFMTFSLTTGAMLSGIILGFATAASVEIGQALNESRDSQFKKTMKYSLFGLLISFFCGVFAFLYLFFSLSGKSDMPFGFYLLVILVISFTLFFSTACTFLQRAVFRARGDTGFLRNLSLMTLLGIKLPGCIFILQFIPISHDCTFYVFLLFLIINIFAFLHFCIFGFGGQIACHIKGAKMLVNY